MKFEMTVYVEVERVAGKFASRGDIEEEIVGVLEGADPGEIAGLGADGATNYEITNWEVSITSK